MNQVLLEGRSVGKGTRSKKPELFVAVALVVLLGLFLAEREFREEARCPWFSKDARLPAVDASPQETVRAYLDTVVRNDRKTAGHIASPAFLQSEGAYPDSPFCNWREISDIRFETPAPAATRDGYREVLDIHLEFDLEQQVAMTRSDGRTHQGYTLGRESPTDRWKIIDAILHG